jgi:Phosphotransferase enzyme family
MIGGLDPKDFSAAPTVEGSKLFKGRGKFHKNECYPIGPYKSTKDYMLACYDKEIYYYTHASEGDIDTDLFEDTSVTDFIEQLNKKRAALAATEMTDEPFVLIHGDFHGRNILMKDDQVAAVLDWEFAGSYPLSESLSDGGINVVEASSEELDNENTIWDRKIRCFIRELAMERKWEQKHIDLLMGDGDYELGRARSEMFP